MKRTAITFCLLVFSYENTLAEPVSMNVIPSAWKLENYIGDNVVAWHTGSVCVNGRITFPSNATRDDKNRFWSVIMAGKAAGKKIFVYYDDAASDCQIISFGLSQE